MNKIMNFSCDKNDEIYLTQILPALLSGKKKQTIRLAWKECDNCHGTGNINKMGSFYRGISNLACCSKCKGTGIIDKPSKYQVGDNIELVWKKENKEYRIIKPYWIKRLKQEYDLIYYYLGYTSKKLIFKYNGCVKTVIKHKEFGDKPVNVFAIDLTKPLRCVK